MTIKKELYISYAVVCARLVRCLTLRPNTCWPISPAMAPVHWEMIQQGMVMRRSSRAVVRQQVFFDDGQIFDGKWPSLQDLLEHLLRHVMEKYLKEEEVKQSDKSMICLRLV